MKFLLYILLFVMGFCGKFFLPHFSSDFINTTHAEEQKIITEKPETATGATTKNMLWWKIQTGQFVPMSFITLKRPILTNKIWRDDASLVRYVGPDFPLSNRDYRANDLVSMSGAHINEAGRISQIRSDAKKSALVMAADFETYFHEPLVAISGFRSSEYQQRLWDLGKCEGWSFCSLPGRSEHQLGIAVDFFDATSETEYLTNPRYKSFYEWMKKNAHTYGWTQSYKHGPEIDWYEIEPWHWRYIGVQTATELHRLDMSYSRFLQRMKIFSQL